jgi:hypothetical protein
MFKKLYERLQPAGRSTNADNMESAWLFSA